MLADTRIAAVVFVIPFTAAVCIVVVESELASGVSVTGVLVLSQSSTSPEDLDDR